MKRISNISQLCALLQSKIDKSLQEDVLPEIKKVMQKAILQEVYNSYTPIMYQRRIENGGLLDEDNIIGELQESGKLSIMNITAPNKSVFGTDISSDSRTILSQWIEFGKVNNQFNNIESYVWTEPRPFMKTTMEMLKDKGIIKRALTRGLKKQRVKFK